MVPLYLTTSILCDKFYIYCIDRTLNLLDTISYLGLTLSSRGKGGGPRVVVSTAAFHARVRGSVPGLGGLKETKMFLLHPRVKVSIVGSLRDQEVACSASDRQGLNFESCVWRTVSSQSSHHPQEVLLAQFSLYVHKGGLMPDSFYFISFSRAKFAQTQSNLADRGLRAMFKLLRSGTELYAPEPSFLCTLFDKLVMPGFIVWM